MRLAFRAGETAIQRAILEPLMRTATTLGHTAWEVGPEFDIAQDGFDAAFAWGGHPIPGVPTFCVENGWLPRWEYQIGLGGINGRHHAAPWDGRSVDVQAVPQRIRRLRTETAPSAYRYADPTERRPYDGPDGDFVLVALQCGSDVNMADVPKRLRNPQKLVDAVTASNPPWAIVAKQHPASAALASHAQVRMGRSFDRLWLHEEGSIHHLLRAPGCRAVVALNSNALHDGLLWGVPGIALGKGLWPKVGGPFLTRLPKDWRQVDRWRASSADTVQAYLSWLLSLQWTPGRAGIRGHVQRLLDLAEGS